MLKWTVFKVSFKKSFLMMKRYMFNFVSGIVTIYIVFLILFYGIKAVGGPTINSSGTLEAMIVGYIVWIFAMNAFQDLSWGLVNEAQMGTLEQMYLTPAGFSWINVATIVSNFVLNFVFTLVIILFIMVTTGKYLHLNLLTLLPLVLFTLGGAYGIGFAMGGLALIYKRIQAFFQIVQFAIIGFMVLPLDRMPWAKALPLAMGNSLVRQAMVGGKSLLALPAGDLLILAVTGVGYFLLGLSAFGLAERTARRRGLLGQY